MRRESFQRSTEEKNREACGIFKISWHMDGYTVCSCGKEDCYQHNPDFTTDPVRLLREISERKLLIPFLGYWFGCAYPPDDFLTVLLQGELVVELINEYILDTTGKLLDAFLEWERRKGYA